jgi:hypothetical protein
LLAYISYLAAENIIMVNEAMPSTCQLPLEMLVQIFQYFQFCRSEKTIYVSIA